MFKQHREWDTVLFNTQNSDNLIDLETNDPIGNRSMKVSEAEKAEEDQEQEKDKDKDNKDSKDKEKDNKDSKEKDKS